MTFLCEICCPSVRQEKTYSKRKKKSLSPTGRSPEEEHSRGARNLKTFQIADTFDSEQDPEVDAERLSDVGSDPTESKNKETSFCYSKRTRPPEEGPGEADAASTKQTVKAIKKMAKRIEGPIQKHPKSGRGLFKKVQDRYVAVVPDKELDAPNATEFLQWKAGTLSWWETMDAFRSGKAPPKGFVPLLKIAKVDISKDDKSGKAVVVKHKYNLEMHELVLIFATNRDAEEWSYALWEFISLIRGQTTST